MHAPGMGPFPYRGYFLHVEGGPRSRRGWYFKKVQAADAEFTAMLRNIVKKRTDA